MGNKITQRFNLHTITPAKRAGQLLSHLQKRHKRPNIEHMLALIEAGCDVNMTCPSTGQSLLHIAASRNLLPVVTALLKKKADPNSCDKSSFTPLMVTRNPEIIRQLIAAGAKTEIENIYKRTAVDMMFYPVAHKAGVQIVPEHVSVIDGRSTAGKKSEDKETIPAEFTHLKCLEALAAGGANLNRLIGKNHNLPLFYVACSIWAEKFVELMVRYKANPLQKGPDGKTPRQIALDKMNSFQHINTAKFRSTLTAIASLEAAEMLRQSAATTQGVDRSTFGDGKITFKKRGNGPR